jgi:CBS domain containing-hemolysin-like protein
MAGLVFNALGRRPRAGDDVAVGDVHLRVEQVDGARITRIRVSTRASPGAA